MAKAKNAGNVKPADARKTATAALTERVGKFLTMTKNWAVEGHEILIACALHIVQYADPRPLNKLLTNDHMEASNLNAMKAWSADFGCVRWVKEAGQEGKFVVNAEKQKTMLADYETSPVKFATALRGQKKFWEYKPNRPFEGFDLQKVILAQIARGEKLSKEEGKKDKVKGAEKITALREAIALIFADAGNDDDGGDAAEADDLAAIHQADRDEAVQVTLN